MPSHFPSSTPITSLGAWWTFQRLSTAIARSFSPYVWANRWLAFTEWAFSTLEAMAPKFVNPHAKAMFGLRVLIGFYWLAMGLHTARNPLWQGTFENWLRLWGPHHPWFWAQDILSHLLLPAVPFWGECLSVGMVSLGLSLILGLLVEPMLVAAFAVFGLIFIVASPIDPMLSSWQLALMVPIPMLLAARIQWIWGVDWWTAPYSELKQAGLLKKAPAKKSASSSSRQLKAISPLEGHRFTRVGPTKSTHEDDLDNDPADEPDVEVFIPWYEREGNQSARPKSLGKASAKADVVPFRSSSQVAVDDMLHRFSQNDDDFDDDEDVEFESTQSKKSHASKPGKVKKEPEPEDDSDDDDFDFDSYDWDDDEE